MVQGFLLLASYGRQLGDPKEAAGAVVFRLRSCDKTRWIDINVENAKRWPLLSELVLPKKEKTCGHRGGYEILIGIISRERQQSQAEVSFSVINSSSVSKQSKGWSSAFGRDRARDRARDREQSVAERQQQRHGTDLSECGARLGWAGGLVGMMNDVEDLDGTWTRSEKARTVNLLCLEFAAK